MITIIDYGVGNINAFVNIYRKLDIDILVARDTETLKSASKIILPGVGHFDYAMQKFTDSGMRDLCHDLVLNQKKPVIGICVGMQMLAKYSEEGRLKGLGWVDGVVKKIDTSRLSYSTRLPHMGWNDIFFDRASPLFLNFEDEARYYFLHSYYFECFDRSISIAEAEYGHRFTCAINYNNIYGVQFHPEKSHHFGINLLHNFAKL